MYARLSELARLLPQRQPWEMLNEGMPEVYDRGLALCLDGDGAWAGIHAFVVVSPS